MHLSFRGLARYVPTAVLLAAAYYGAARLGLHYATIGRSASLIWPSTGIAFAALLLLGDRYWVGVALGAFLASVVHMPAPAAAGVAVGTTLEVLLATYLFRRSAGPRPELDDVRHVRALVVLVAPVSAIVAAIIGPIALWANGLLSAATALSAVPIWWMGDMLGILVVAPVLLTWTTRPPDQAVNRGILEIAALCLGAVIVAETTLGLSLRIQALREIDYTYLLFPFVIWAALRFGSRGASLMTLMVAGVAVWHAVHGTGPFVAETASATLFSVACYLLVVAVTGMGLAAAVQWERGRAAKALGRSEEQLRVALNGARMGAWSLALNTNVAHWDERMNQLFRLGPGEQVLSYDDFLIRVHPEDRASLHQELLTALEQGYPFEMEFRILLPDDQVRWILDRGEAVYDANNRPVYMTGVCYDVTNRRIAEQRIQQANRMDSVGQLAGGVAHEANNQMSVILGAVHFVLRNPDLPEAVREDVLQVRRAAERTAEVTAQLLAFSRRQLLKPEVLDLNTLVKTWGLVLRRVVGEDCVVTLQFGTDVGNIKADPGQLEQVLLNLALNARDAMPNGGDLTIETSSATLTEADTRLKPDVMIRPGRYAVLSVTDTGYGMDKATLSRVFEPFFTTKEPGKGTGLGLSTVYGIVKQSGGYVWAYSEPGQGTTFKIYLPVNDEPMSEPEEPINVPPSAAAETILVVEDEPFVRSTAARALEEAGYHVLQAANGDAALEMLRARNGRIDLLFTDMIMPEMGGRDLAARVAAIAPGIPMIFTSGYPDGDMARRGLIAGGATFIQKPFSPEAVVKLVYQVLNRHAVSVEHPAC